jgi:hypothetical protein
MKQYIQHKGRAIARDIPFTLSYEEWYQIWFESGHIEERGRRRGQYCMSRIGDVGGYEKGNVFIQLHSKNVTAAHQGVKRPNKCSIDGVIYPTVLAALTALHPDVEFIYEGAEDDDEKIGRLNHDDEAGT